MIQIIMLVVGLMPLGPGIQGHSDNPSTQDTRRRRQLYIALPGAEKPPEKPTPFIPVSAQ